MRFKTAPKLNEKLFYYVRKLIHIFFVLFEKSGAKLYTYERRTGVPNLKNRIMSEDEFESICKEVNVKPSLALDNKKVCKVLNDDLNKHLQSFKEILRIDEGIPLPSERCNLLREVLLTELVN